MPRPLRLFLLFIIAVVGIFLAGGAIALYSDTLVSPWTIVTIGLVAGIITSPLLCRAWDRLTLLGSDWTNRGVNIIFVGIIASFSALLANRAGAAVEAVTTTATIERKYTTERTTGGGRRHAMRRKHTVYNIDLLFQSGTRKHQEVSLSTYNRIRSGSEIPVEVRRGLLGWPVIAPKFTKRSRTR